MRAFRILIPLLLIGIPSVLWGQFLGEMEWEEVPESERILYLVRNPEVAVLVVHSTIPVLSFDCNMGIIKVDNTDPGEYRIHLYPGANIITIKAEGFLPLKQLFYIEKKNYREIKMTIKKPPEEFGAIQIESSPWGANIIWNNIATGYKTPYTIKDQPIGNHRLKLTSPGFYDKDTIVVVRKDQTLNNKLILNRIHYTPYSIIGSFDTPGFTTGIAVSGNYAYLADGKAGLRILDISDPAKLTEVSFLRLEGDIRRIDFSGDCVYTTDIDLGLFIINVSDPSKPYQVGYYNTPGYANNVEVVGHFAYVSDDYKGLIIIRLVPPKDIIVEKTLDTPGYVMGICMDNNLIYLADGKVGLWIIDVSNLENIFTAGYCKLKGNALAVALMDNCACVASGKSGLKVVNVLNPGNPYPISEFNTSGYAWDVEVLNQRAYIADGKAGLRVLDISDPFSPYEIGFCNTPGEAHNLTIVGNKVYIADGDKGLQIIYIGD